MYKFQIKHFWIIGFVGLLVLSSSFIENIFAAQTSIPVEAGYRNFSYAQSNKSCSSTPTGEKPESKLWFNDGIWWGSLCNDMAEEHHIHRLDLTTQSWIDTGIIMDQRPGAKLDILWDDQPLWHPWLWRGTSLNMARAPVAPLQDLGLISGVPREPHLYIAAHGYVRKGQVSSSSYQWGRLYRYSYDPQTKSYSLDQGFPVNITRGRSETLTLAKDTIGQLWVTYVEDNKVMINHSAGSDSDWGEPYVLPVDNAANLSDDDISAIIAFDGRIGVMWSNQNTSATYFAVHLDGTPDQQWEVVTVYTGADGASDDHMDLKVDDLGNLFAVVKTSFQSPLDPLIILLTCRAGTGCISAGDWQNYTIYQVQDDDSRPTLLLDTEHRELHVFTTDLGIGGEIHHKVTSLDHIQFSPGPGEIFIQSSLDPYVNNPTSTKQTLNSTTGLALLSSDHKTKHYLHNYINLGNRNSPIITSFTPMSGNEGAEVILTGNNFNGVTSVAFNGTPAQNLTVDSNTQLRVNVPTGATSGKISVTGDHGAALSVANFIMLIPIEITSFRPTRGAAGAEVILTGAGFYSVAKVTFNGTPATSLIIDSDTQIRVNVPLGATSGLISATNIAGVSSSTSTFTVLP